MSRRIALVTRLRAGGAERRGGSEYASGGQTIQVAKIRLLAALLSVAAVVGVSFAAAGCWSPPGAQSPAKTPTAVVRVDGGSVRGFRSGKVSVYLGIPFAAPPVGRLRWRPPQPVRPWQGVKDCVRFAPSCPQQSVPGLGHRAVGPQSEDCLYLNVWSPAHAAGARLPVMVWIHGGGFVCGSSALAGGRGDSLSANGHVVVVSISYRLGIFGYFALSALSRESAHHVSGDYGVLDQIAALRWVRRNIAAFGGDPRRVTIFGESAGGQSVIGLLVSPLSRGLFARAIAESPRYEDQGIGLWSTRPLRAQVREGEAIAAALGAPAGPGQLEKLRGMSAARLLQAAAPAPRPLVEVFSEPPRPSFQPVIDGYVLPDEPWDMLRRGDWARVPVIVGSTRDEANMWFHGVPPALRVQAAAECRRRVAWYAGPLDGALQQWFAPTANGGFVQSTSRMMTVLEFNAAARYTAAWAARSGVPAYLYYFTWAPPGDPWGPMHGAELPYVFDTSLASRSSPLYGVERRLAAEVSGYWARFAATGNPNGGGAPTWPRYAAGPLRTLEIGVPTRTISGPYARPCLIANRLTNRQWPGHPSHIW